MIWKRGVRVGGARKSEYQAVIVHMPKAREGLLTETRIKIEWVSERAKAREKKKKIEKLWRQTISLFAIYF